jgi:hypothetical protein
LIFVLPHFSRHLFPLINRWGHATGPSSRRRTKWTILCSCLPGPCVPQFQPALTGMLARSTARLTRLRQASSSTSRFDPQVSFVCPIQRVQVRSSAQQEHKNGLAGIEPEYTQPIHVLRTKSPINIITPIGSTNDMIQTPRIATKRDGGKKNFSWGSISYPVSTRRSAT